MVQDPEEAAFPAMPFSAVGYVEPDYVATLKEIPSILVGFVEEVSAMEYDVEPNAVQAGAVRSGDDLTEFTFPECGGRRGWWGNIRSGPLPGGPQLLERQPGSGHAGR